MSNNWSDTVSSWQDQVSPIPSLVREHISKSKLKPEEAARGLRSLQFDPLAVQYAMGFKDRKYSLTYDILKRIPNQVAIVAAILQTRCNQVAAFSVPYRSSKSVGFVVKHKDPSHLTTKSEMEFIKDLETFVYNCGYSAPNPYNKVKRDDFESFLKKTVRDSLIFDQTCIEVVPDRRGMPYEFMAVDASTIRIAAVDTPYGPNNTWRARSPNYSGSSSLAADGGNRNPYNSLRLYQGTKYDKSADFVQVINGQIENVYDRDELIFGVRNPRTDIYIQGYGYGELEQLVTIVTAHLYAEEYNRRFFCIPGDSLIATDQGTKTIESLSDSSFRVWNGYDWRNAKAFKTGHRKLSKLHLKSTVVVESSPEHRYLAYRQSFDAPQWLELKDVRAGDYVLQNKTPIDNALNHADLLVDKKYSSQRVWGNDFVPTKELVEDEDFWTLIGFAMGDGSFQLNSGKLYVFPNYEKDKEVYALADKVLSKYGLNYKISKTNKHVKRLDGEYGYESILIQHKEFVSWLSDIGFRDSTDGKRIPESVFCLSLKYRRAFIRGLFSADGHSHRHPTGYKTPTVFSASGILVKDIQQLLLSCGISFSMTKSRQEINVSNVMDYSKDIGFIQSYKNAGYKRVNKDRWDVLPSQLSQDFAAFMLTTKNWSSLCKKDRDLVCKASRGVTSLSAPRVSSILEELNEEVPYYLNYHFSEVTRVDHLDLEVPMYDVEVFDEEHIFLANGTAVHNSQGCVGGETLVTTKEGITPIKELVGTSFSCWNGTEFVEADVVDSGFKKSFRLTLANNFSVISSPDHKFFSIDESGVPSMRSLSELKSGDFVAEPDQLVEFEALPSIDVERSYFPQVPPVSAGKLDSNFYEFIGYLVGDGYISNTRASKNSKHNKRNYNISCVFGPKDYEVKEKFTSMLSDRGFSFHQRKSGGQWGGKKIDTLTIRNMGLFNFLKDTVGMSTAKSHEKTVPLRVLSESAENRCAFLRGYFSADGFVKKEMQYNVCSSSEKLIEGVQQVLWSLGLSSSVSHTLLNESGKECYYLWVRQPNKFKEMVGFIQSYKKVSPTKKDSLGKIPESFQKVAFNSILGKDLYSNKTTARSRAQLKKLANNNNVHVDGLEYRWSKIKAIEDLGIQVPMYDVRQIDHKHRWSAGGCISSNSAPKGILNFKGDAMTPDMLEGFRRQWRANLEGVENCLSGDTNIYTKENGFVSLSDVCGDKDEVPVHIWTGTSWETGLVYKTKEEKKLCHTKLDNAVTLSTSPDHKIKVIGESGDPEWRIQSELAIGDVVLINKKDPSVSTSLGVLGKKATSELLEVFGWILGDGSIGPRSVQLFYHQDIEQEILQNHLSVLREYFPAAEKHVTVRTEEQIERLKDKYGFKNVAPTVTQIRINDADVAKWFVSHGFVEDGKKVIPPYLFTMPAEFRESYLRGVFSADGNNAKLRSPVVTISSDYVREQVKQLLLSIGIRCSLSEGKTKVVIEGTKRSCKESPSLLRVKDRDRFFDTVGFIQPHKQPKSLKKLNESNKLDKVPRSTVNKYLTKCRKANKESGYSLLTRRERMDLNSILCGVDGCSKPRLIRYLEKCGLTVPAWISDYNTASVVKTTNSGIYVPMYDVSIDHDDHMFMGNNILTSNSWKTPILQSEQGVDWIDLHPSNRDMEYGSWLEYLIKITAAVFLIDPAELNFDLKGGVQQTPLFESSQEWKLKASRDRGLKPLLRFLAKTVNENIINKIDDHFVFDFAGLEELTDQEKHTLRTEQVSSYLTLNEVRRSDDLPDLKHGDIPMNPTYLQAMQQKAAEEQQRQQMQQQQAQLDAQMAADSGGGGSREEGGGSGKAKDGVKTPEYSDSFGKSLVAAEGSKYLEIDLSDLDGWKEAL